MNSQPENQASTGSEPAPCHPSVRKWIYLRALLIGLLVAGWWIMFAPDSMMAFGLKIGLGIVAGLVATGSYLFNLRHTLYPPKTAAVRAETPEPGQE